MKQPKYDIFISYRRDGGAQYARTLQLMLEKKGYRVFLDYDELIDEKFSPQIESAIKNSTIFIILLTKGSMARCANDGDWVRHEIEIAIDNDKRIIPINPDGNFDGIPDSVPAKIKSAIESIQYSEIDFGQTLNVTVDLMIKNRIRRYIHHRSWRPWLLYVGIGCCICTIVATVWFVWHKKKISALKDEIESLKKEVTFDGRNIEWPDSIGKETLLTIKEIFNDMRLIDGGEFMQGACSLEDGTYHENVEQGYETPMHKVEVGSFYISKFEVTVGQWNVIMNDNRGGCKSLPIADVTFNQAMDFAKKLFEITGVEFRLPTESEWEYAAKGGCRPEGFMFAGSLNPDEVAWFAPNSGGKSHSDFRSSTGTIDDLYNMSGNVSEWCNTQFIPYDESIPLKNERAMVIRGGNYDSDEYEITVTHRDSALPETSIPTLGFRLVITK